MSPKGRNQHFPPRSLLATTGGFEKVFKALLGRRTIYGGVKTYKDSSVLLHYERSHQASHASFPAVLLTQPPALHVLTRLPARAQVPREEKPQWHGAFQL